MLKNLVVNLKGLRKNTANLILYRGPVKRMFINDINIDNNELIPSIKTEIATNNSIFYPSYDGYVNIDYQCILPDITDAESYINHLLEIHKQEIMGLLLSPNNTPERRKNLLKHLKLISSHLYYDEDELIPSHYITEKQFQKIKVPKDQKNPFSKTL